MSSFHGGRPGWQPARYHPVGDGTQTSIVININDGGSTSRGFLIGILSAFGSAGVAVLVLAIFFFFKYTSRGRILLDRIGRPGEFDDEQAFAHEEAEALESMDELQRTEYLRAKGTTSPSTHTLDPTRLTYVQLSLRPILLNLYRPTYPCRNSSPSKKRASRLGNSNPSLKSPTASLRPGPKLNFMIPSVAFKAICQFQNKTRCIIGRQRYMINPKPV